MEDYSFESLAKKYVDSCNYEKETRPKVMKLEDQFCSWNELSLYRQEKIIRCYFIINSIELPSNFKNYKFSKIKYNKKTKRIISLDYKIKNTN